MQRPLVARRVGLAVAYEMAIALLGWGALLAYTLATRPQIDLAAALAFLILAVALKRAGFRVARLVTHSLAGVATLAALIALGPCCGAWVAALAGSLFLASRIPGAGRPVGLARARRALFGGGLNALMALAGAALYRALGGRWAPAALQWADLVPLTSLALAWFLADHLGWCVRIALEEGLVRLRPFLRAIYRHSILVELAPLPLAAVVATAYHGAGTPAWLLLAIFLVAAGAILRRLNLTLEHARLRVARLTNALTTFSRALLASELDVMALCRLLYEHTAHIVDARQSWLGLYDARHGTLNVALSSGGAEPPPDLLAWMQKQHSPLLVRDAAREGLPWDDSQRAPFRSALFVPLQAADALIGILAAQSPAPAAYSDDDLRTVVAFANLAAMAVQNARSLEAEQRRARQLATVGEVSRRVVAILGMERLFSGVVHLVRDTFGYYDVQLFTIGPDGEVVFQASTNPNIQQHGMPVSPGQGLVGWVAQTGQQAVVDDVAAEPRFRPVEWLQATRSEAVVPLRIEERLVGILDVQSDRPGAFGEEDLFVLRTLADQVAIAIEDNRLYRAEKARRQLADTLREMAGAVNSTLELPAVLDLVLTQLERVIRYDAAAILEWQDGHFCVVAGRGPRYTAPDDRLTPDEDAALRRLISEPAPFAFSGAGSIALAVPLLVKERLIGALVLERQGQQNGYSAEETGVVSAFANQAAVAIENAHLYTAQQEEAWVSTALLQVAESLANLIGVDQVLDAIIRLLPLLVGVDRGAIFLHQEEAGGFRAVRVHGLAGQARQAFLDQTLEALAPGLASALADQAPIAVELQGSGWAAEAAAALGIAGGLALPLRTGGETIGLLMAGYERATAQLTRNQRAILGGIANQAALAIENARLYRESLESERLAQELRVAHQIQATFLPERCPEIAGWSIAASSRPAREVGGDFYDFVGQGKQRLGLVIADVSDKGVPAALFMALSRTVTRAVAAEGRSPAATLRRVNDLLLADAGSGMFVTLFYGILDIGSGRLVYSSAGHNPPYWYQQHGGRLSRLSARGIALGVIERPCFEEEQITLQPGDSLVLYTDGVTESLDPYESEFGEEGLERAILSARANHAEPLVAAINGAVQSFVRGAPQHDDYTLLVITRHGSPKGNQAFDREGDKG